MEEFQNKIKDFRELLHYVFTDLTEKARMLFYSIAVILTIEILLFLLLNSQWLPDYIFMGQGSFFDNFLAAGQISITISVVAIFLMSILQFSIITCIREDFDDFKSSVRKGIGTILRVIIPVTLLGGILSGLFVLADQYRVAVIIIAIITYFWSILATYIALREKRRGVDAFVRALHVLRKNFINFNLKIILFFSVLFLSLLSPLFFIYLLYMLFFQSSTWFLIITLVLAFLIILLGIVIANLYLSVLSENVWKIRKHVAFYSSHPLYLLAINIFLMVIFLILILGTVV
ncbi:MAG: hypothetical protein BWY34_00186 [Parcubacteria group bacterium ADurb.Bin247]|nr:MAG: hypothetical protein BWY34_00186 [Parcubacteria group bacterium ADurb.Bin247]